MIRTFRSNTHPVLSELLSVMVLITQTGSKPGQALRRLVVKAVFREFSALS